jgi:hypothetical protein
MPVPYPLKDAHGRLRGLATVERWQQSNAGRAGARKSPWRFGALHHSSPPPRRHPNTRTTR